ncbi:hypothetical protein RM545_04465 [Zunongwangia sp. F260]|uniref:Uncharacterized protein n=1 Tax=Autumnicola lenta TaxID=3075593 RepID=A0ABU3CHV4_9FLAO|nr:hypothetical protein [Zunongwangia sp. F260]MDT0645933.1 hypothetical protein [Zunongwangia sp. F260]
MRCEVKGSRDGVSLCARFWAVCENDNFRPSVLPRIEKIRFPADRADFRREDAVASGKNTHRKWQLSAFVEVRSKKYEGRNLVSLLFFKAVPENGNFRPSVLPRIEKIRFPAEPADFRREDAVTSEKEGTLKLQLSTFIEVRSKRLEGRNLVSLLFFKTVPENDNFRPSVLLLIH